MKRRCLLHRLDAYKGRSVRSKRWVPGLLGSLEGESRIPQFQLSSEEVDNHAQSLSAVELSSAPRGHQKKKTYDSTPGRRKTATVSRPHRAGRRVSGAPASASAPTRPGPPRSASCPAARPAAAPASLAETDASGKATYQLGSFHKKRDTKRLTGIEYVTPLQSEALGSLAALGSL